MANGTAGLGQNATVFDFSGIAEFGLQVDAMAQQRAEKKSAKFQAGNKDLLDPMSKVGIRDIDKPFIEKKYAQFMDASTEAYRTEDAAAAQKARAMKAELAELISTSQAYQKSWIDGQASTYNSESYKTEPQMYEERMEWYKNNTAMNEQNGGAVGDAGFFFHTELTDYAPKDINAEALAIAGQVKNASYDQTSTPNSEGGNTSVKTFNEDKYAQNMEIQWNNFLNTENADALLFENYMIKEYGGRSKFDPKEVKAMKDRLAYGKQLRSQGYESVDDIYESNEFSPLEKAKAVKAFAMEDDMLSMGREIFESTVYGAIQEGTQYSKTKGSGGGDGQSEEAKYGANMGTTFEQLLGTQADTSKIAGFQEGTALGMSSTKSGATKSIGKGKNETFYEGITVAIDPDGNKQYYINSWIPDASDWEKIQALRDGGATIDDIMSEVKFVLTPQPLTKFKGDIPQGELAQMVSIAEKQAEEQQQILFDLMDEE